MKIVACVLAVFLAALVGGIAGHGVATDNARETIAKNCDHLKGFSVKQRIYDCARKAKN